MDDLMKVLLNPANPVGTRARRCDIHVFVLDLVHGTIEAATDAFIELAADRGISLSAGEARAYLDAQLEVA